MNTLLYSLAGIIFLVGISFLFSYFSHRRGIKWENRINAVRRTHFGPIRKSA